MNATQASTRHPGINRAIVARIARTGLIAAGSAAVANTVVWLAGNAIGTMTVPLAVVPVASIVGVLTGGLAYGLLSHVTEHHHKIFIALAVLIMLLSGTGPIGAMSSPPPGMAAFNLATVVATEIMHVIAGGLAIAGYTRAGRSPVAG